MNKITFFLLILSFGLSIPTSIRPIDLDSSSPESPPEHHQRRYHRDNSSPQRDDRSPWQGSGQRVSPQRFKCLFCVSGHSEYFLIF